MAVRTPDPDPKVKLFKATLSIEIEAESVSIARARVRQCLAEALKKAMPSDLVQRVVRKKYSSRADRLAEAEGYMEDATSIITELKEELEAWRDGLPENLQGGDKASQLEDAIGQLEEAEGNVEQAKDNCSGVEFPGMFG